MLVFTVVVDVEVVVVEVVVLVVVGVVVEVVVVEVVVEAVTAFVREFPGASLLGLEPTGNTELEFQSSTQPNGSLELDSPSVI